MKVVKSTVYVVRDGTQFKSAKEAKQYEALCRSIERDVGALIGRPVSGMGNSVKRNASNCRELKAILIEHAAKLVGGPFIKWSKIPDDVNPMGIAIRWIDDSGIRCLRSAWRRLCCINWDSFIEYDQPYYALNPSEANAK